VKFLKSSVMGVAKKPNYLDFNGNPDHDTNPEVFKGHFICYYDFYNHARQSLTEGCVIY